MEKKPLELNYKSVLKPLFSSKQKQTKPKTKIHIHSPP
jgi:hypothetical protein